MDELACDLLDRLAEGNDNVRRRVEATASWQTWLKSARLASDDHALIEDLRERDLGRSSFEVIIAFAGYAKAKLEQSRDAVRRYDALTEDCPA